MCSCDPRGLIWRNSAPPPSQRRAAWRCAPLRSASSVPGRLRTRGWSTCLGWMDLDHLDLDLIISLNIYILSIYDIYIYTYLFIYVLYIYACVITVYQIDLRWFDIMNPIGPIANRESCFVVTENVVSWRGEISEDTARRHSSRICSRTDRSDFHLSARHQLRVWTSDCDFKAPWALGLGGSGGAVCTCVNIWSQTTTGSSFTKKTVQCWEHRQQVSTRTRLIQLFEHSMWQSQGQTPTGSGIPKNRIFKHCHSYINMGWSDIMLHHWIGLPTLQLKLHPTSSTSSIPAAQSWAPTCAWRGAHPPAATSAGAPPRRKRPPLEPPRSRGRHRSNGPDKWELDGDGATWWLWWMVVVIRLIRGW